MDFIEGREEITADYAPGEVITVEQHDGRFLRLKKLSAEHDPTDRVRTMNYVQEHASRGEVVTGLLYIDPKAIDMHEHLNTVDTPLNQLDVEQLCPGASALEKFNASLR
jgi:2-oxoglutarate ferredoxin oxidoreductase subunit beta